MNIKDIYSTIKMAEEKVAVENKLVIIIDPKTAEVMFDNFIGAENVPHVFPSMKFGNRFLFVGKYLGYPAYIDLLNQNIGEFIYIVRESQFEILNKSLDDIDVFYTVASYRPKNINIAMDNC